ncbi:Na(+)/H(+) antiporter subunit C [Rubeoparvulum massiliense]|uniref:Na(+)/H(+) antiporter subunit C n=1 Tax=Rubeoparvulum massiliense TaxID=1631346 RepID=UPI00065E2226|nr:Na(+)/H(+) antiporter subunit C [Rubeoparvulum massiliense]
MELLMIVVVGVLLTVATYLVMSRNLFRIILGTVIYSHGVHLLIMTMSKLKRGAPPVITDGVTAYTDPIPQALILTSIVIGFGVTSYLLVLAYSMHKKLGTDDMDELRGVKDE